MTSVEQITPLHHPILSLTLMRSRPRRVRVLPENKENAKVGHKSPNLKVTMLKGEEKSRKRVLGDITNTRLELVNDDENAAPSSKIRKIQPLQQVNELQTPLNGILVEVNDGRPRTRLNRSLNGLSPTFDAINVASVSFKEDYKPTTAILSAWYTPTKTNAVVKCILTTRYQPSPDSRFNNEQRYLPNEVHVVRSNISDHPHIVKYLECTEIVDRSTWFPAFRKTVEKDRSLDRQIGYKAFAIVMPEFSNYKSYFSKLGKKSDRIQAVLGATRDILSAIQHVHTARVIHGDITHQNVMFEMREGKGFAKAVLIDFDISESLAKNSEFAQNPNTMGTNYYIAPELDSKHRYSCKVDMYSLGVLIVYWLFYALHTIEFPAYFSAKDIAKTLKNLQDCNELRGNKVSKLIELAKLCLDKNPDLRPDAQNAIEILGAA